MLVRTLSLLILFAIAVSTDAATGKLRGRVTDAVTRKGIPAADIQITEIGGTFHKNVISNADGTYTVADLALGRRLEIRFSATGYGPPNTGREATLTGNETVLEDVPLLCDCTAASYWKTWAEKVLRQARQGKGEAGQIVADSWGYLGAAGLSAGARSQAAQEFVSMDATLTYGNPIQEFAMYDAGVIVKTENAVKLSLSGDSPVVPTNVVLYVPASIAAAEVRKKVGNVTQQENILRTLEKDWGKDMVQEAIRINQEFTAVEGRARLVAPQVREK